VLAIVQWSSRCEKVLQMRVWTTSKSPPQVPRGPSRSPKSFVSIAVPFDMREEGGYEMGTDVKTTDVLAAWVLWPLGHEHEYSEVTQNVGPAVNGTLEVK